MHEIPESTERDASGINSPHADNGLSEDLPIAMDLGHHLILASAQLYPNGGKVETEMPHTTIVLDL
jgi:hypothetical protein